MIESTWYIWPIWVDGAEIRYFGMRLTLEKHLNNAKLTISPGGFIFVLYVRIAFLGVLYGVLAHGDH